MVASVTINPQAQTSGQGLFNVQSTGLRQGTAYPDPATNYALRTGFLDSNETIPMWGGVGIYEYVPSALSISGTLSPGYAMGVKVGRATALTGSKALRGFSVFDQAYGMITSPESFVPLSGSQMQVMSYRIGSGARIAVAADPVLVSQRGADINGPLSTANLFGWDFTNQLLIPFEGSLTISSYTYNSTSGLVTLTMSAPVTFGPGDSIVVASLNISGLNGTWTAASASGTTVTYVATTGLGGSPSGGGTLTVGGAASQSLPVALLDIQTSGCMVVQYNSTTGQANWNFDGCCAIIQI